MATAKDALSAIETHEKEFKLIYKSIDARLEAGSKKFDKLEMMLWGVYPFILATVIAAKFI